jgi:hypothetical protein
MNKVFISKTPNADTRSMVTLDASLVHLDTINHIKAVNDVLITIGNQLKIIGVNHDYTKIEYFQKFYQDLSTKKQGAEFKQLEWWQIHKQERHHLNDRCPDDVDLLDVIEMIVDCVCAGKARTGNVFPIEISNEILQKALKNTIEKLKEKVVVE